MHRSKKPLDFQFLRRRGSSVVWQCVLIPIQVLLWVMMFFVSTGVAWAGEAAVLTRVEQLRALTPEEARECRPVCLTGVVTYCYPIDGHAFLQDESGGVFFHPGKIDTANAVQLEMGDKVEIRGISWAGSFSPSVAGEGSNATSGVQPVALKRLGKSPLPTAATPPFDELPTGDWHEQLVSVRVVIRHFNYQEGTGPRIADMILSGPSGKTIKAWSPKIDPAHMATWIDREVDVLAVMGVGGDPRGQLAMEFVRLLIADSSWITPCAESTRTTISGGFTAFDGMLRGYEPPTARDQRLLADGTISLVKPGEGFYLTNGSRGVWVGTPQETEFHVGDVVNVAGYVRGEGLSDGIVKIRARGSFPAARLLGGGELSTDEARNALVSTEGVLLEVREDGGNTLMKVKGTDGTIIRATGPRTPRLLLPDSRLLLTGIFNGQDILLRDSGDIVVLENAPWLTEKRRNALITGVIITLILGAIWLILLKIQVARQTELIQAQVVHRTLKEERQRLSRELHDTLEQHLAGLHIQLGALRDRLPDSQEPVRKIAEGAARMLDHCREEARRSIFELRSQTLRREGLPAALEQLASEMNHDGGTEVIAEVKTWTTQLDSTSEFHLLRCAQEAVANALKHASARKIFIRLEQIDHESRLVISDDGCGFDPTVAPKDHRSHFGLIHFKERADRIKAKLSITSAPGCGTTIAFTLPTP